MTKNMKNMGAKDVYRSLVLYFLNVCEQLSDKLTPQKIIGVGVAYTKKQISLQTRHK